MRWFIVLATACRAGAGPIEGGSSPADTPEDPAPAEVCNGLDDDGDGAVDEDTESTTWYADSDGDGVGSDTTSTTACAAPDGFVETGGDCDDAASGISPHAVDLAGACGDGVDDCTGRPCRWSGSHELDVAATAAWVGDHPGDWVGKRIAALADIDGDGRRDVAFDEFVFTSLVPGTHASHEGAWLELRTGWLGAEPQVRSAGDVDGDGYQDLIVGVEATPPESDAPEAWAWVIRAPTGGPVDVRAAGVPLSAPAQVTAHVGVAFYPGAPSGPAYEPSAWVEAPVTSLNEAGDVTGDGVPDLAVGASFWEGAENGAGAVALYSHLPSGTTG